MKKKRKTNPVKEIHKILNETETIVRDIVPITDLETDDVRSFIVGSWINHELKLGIDIFHRCDFFEVRTGKYDENGKEKYLGCYILLAINNGFDTHVCKFHDGKKEVIVGYNAYRDEIVLSPSGITFERGTSKSWDWFSEMMCHDPNFKEDSFAQNDQIFKKGFVTLSGSDELNKLNEAFEGLLGHNGFIPTATEI